MKDESIDESTWHSDNDSGKKQKNFNLVNVLKK